AGSVVSTTNGGVVTQAVGDVAAAGALYFSSAANSGSKDKGTSGAWEGNFADAGSSNLGELHDFDTSGNVNPFKAITATGGVTNLSWSDPLGGSGNDYNLFILDSTASFVAAASTNVQNGTQDPYEQINGSPSGFLIIVVQKAGAVVSPRFLHLDIN